MRTGIRTAELGDSNIAVGKPETGKIDPEEGNVRRENSWRKKLESLPPNVHSSLEVVDPLETVLCGQAAKFGPDGVESGLQ